MLEGQVAMLSCGLLTPGEAVALLDTLFASPLYTAGRHSFLLYPDRVLPGFFERNRLDAAALALPVVQRLLAENRSDLLQPVSYTHLTCSAGGQRRQGLIGCIS